MKKKTAAKKAKPVGPGDTVYTEDGAEWRVWYQQDNFLELFQPAHHPSAPIIVEANKVSRTKP